MDKGYFWLIIGLLFLVAINNSWWWFTILLTWTLLFTALPILLNKVNINKKNQGDE
tara:strand:+ start:547 stop:714 length:168 start_codon:yes stop_codon:yes gene_type:complete